MSKNKPFKPSIRELYKFDLPSRNIVIPEFSNKKDASTGMEIEHYCLVIGNDAPGIVTILPLTTSNQQSGLSHLFYKMDMRDCPKEIQHSNKLYSYILCYHILTISIDRLVDKNNHKVKDIGVGNPLTPFGTLGKNHYIKAKNIAADYIKVINPRVNRT